MTAMYQTDSFHTLSIPGQAGLVAVSLGFAIGACMLVRHLTRGQHWFVRLGIWALLYWLFVWLSPQGYYAYYMLIFDGLPIQWVVGRPSPLLEILHLLGFTGPRTLSAHGLGVLGWILLALALWPHRSNCRDAAN